MAGGNKKRKGEKGEGKKERVQLLVLWDLTLRGETDTNERHK